VCLTAVNFLDCSSFLVSSVVLSVFLLVFLLYTLSFPHLLQLVSRCLVQPYTSLSVVSQPVFSSHQYSVISLPHHHVNSSNTSNYITHIFHLVQPYTSSSVVSQPVFSSIQQSPVFSNHQYSAVTSIQQSPSSSSCQ
jgi:hypothetical protein